VEGARSDGSFVLSSATQGVGEVERFEPPARTPSKRQQLPASVGGATTAEQAATGGASAEVAGQGSPRARTLHRIARSSHTVACALCVVGRWPN
jgi:hypothetical protein